MTIYTDLKAVTDKLLGPGSKFAQGTMLLRRLTPGTGPAYNPGPPTVTDYPLSGTATGVDRYRADGVLVLVGDRMAIVAVPQELPTPADKLIIDTVEHQILKFDLIPPAGTPVACIIYARK